MPEEEPFQMLDLSKLDVRVRCVLRRLKVETVEKLLGLNERKLSSIKNCGAKTIANIIKLQKEYGKELAPQKE